MLPETDFARMLNMRLPHLREFHFDVSGEFCLGVEVMEMFVKVMPNMDRFSGQVDNSSLRVVCRNWKGLRELRIKAGGEGVDDEGITGILLAGTGSEERNPNIGDLKILQNLTIMGGEISDLSVWKVFLKLEHLQDIQVFLSQQTSDEAMNALRKTFHRGAIRYPERRSMDGTLQAE